MEYQSHILAHVYVGTDLSPCQFSSPQGKTKDYYSICCVLWEKFKKGQKTCKISGFQLEYSELSPLHPLLWRFFYWSVSTEECFITTNCKKLLAFVLETKKDILFTVCKKKEFLSLVMVNEKIILFGWGPTMVYLDTPQVRI